MKVFISWSGEFSQSVAYLLKKYLPAIIQDLELFVSSHDIESGTRWASRLSGELDTTNYGIICLSQSNLQSPWILFEAGALSKFQDSSLCSLLLDGLSPTDISSPLSQFQNRRFERNNFRKLVHDINSKREKPLSIEQFDLLFEAFWPKIDEEYKKLLITFSGAEKTKATKRNDRELLEEILFRLRELDRTDINSQWTRIKNTPPIQVSHEQLLEQRVTLDSLQAYTEWKFPGMEISAHWQSALLRDITISKYPTLRHIDDAVNRAAPAVKAYQVEEPQLFSTGTDFITKSLGFIDADFRAHHSFGQKTLDAFEKYGHLIKL